MSAEFSRNSHRKRSSRLTTYDSSAPASPVCTTSRLFGRMLLTRTSIDADVGYSECLPIVLRRFGNLPQGTTHRRARLIVHTDELLSHTRR